MNSKSLLPWFSIPLPTHRRADEQLENVFQSLEQQQQPAVLRPGLESQAEQSQTRSASQPQDADLLARTAGLLIQSVDHERNPKFVNSQFLGLMKQLRDRTAIVQGNDIVSAPPDLQLGQGRGVSAVDPKGKGKAIPSVVTVTQGPGASQLQAPSFPLRMAEQNVNQDANIGFEEDENEAYFRQDNEDYTNYWNAHHTYVPSAVAPSAEWQQLQRDWDKFEATSTGVRPLSEYQFQHGNPYLLGERSFNHTMHAEVRSFPEVCNPHRV
jgi:peroxin-5